MNVRLIASSIFALFLFSFAHGQQVAGAGAAVKQDLEHRIALQQESVRQAEAAHLTDIELAGRYARLGVLCEIATQWARSEAAVEHAVSLARHAPEPSEELASDLSQLGGLHLAMGKLRESEKEEMEGLRIREKLGDRLQIARTWNDLAELFLARQQFKKARDIAEKAVAEFVANSQADVSDRTVARSALSMAMCYLKDCPSAIPLLKDAIAEGKAHLSPDDFPIAFGDYLLGYAYWKSGQMSDAAQHMQDGVAAMSRQLGWGHPAYVNALKQYELFLRESRQVDAADLIRRQIRQAEAVVDVHSIETHQGMAVVDGSR